MGIWASAIIFLIIILIIFRSSSAQQALFTDKLATDLKALVLVELVDLVEHFVQRADDARLRSSESVPVVFQPAD